MDPHAPLVGDYSLIQIAAIAGGLVVALIVLRMLRRLTGGPAGPDKFQAKMQCQACGFVGVVPKFKPACRKCGNKSLSPVP